MQRKEKVRGKGLNPWVRRENMEPLEDKDWVTDERIVLKWQRQ